MHYDLSSTVFQRTRGGGGDLIPAGPLNVVIRIGSIVCFFCFIICLPIKYAFFNKNNTLLKCLWPATVSCQSQVSLRPLLKG